MRACWCCCCRKDGDEICPCHANLNVCVDPNTKPPWPPFRCQYFAGVVKYHGFHGHICMKKWSKPKRLGTFWRLLVSFNVKDFDIFQLFPEPNCEPVEDRWQCWFALIDGWWPTCVLLHSFVKAIRVMLWLAEDKAKTELTPSVALEDEKMHVHQSGKMGD